MYSGIFLLLNILMRWKLWQQNNTGVEQQKVRCGGHRKKELFVLLHQINSKILLDKTYYSGPDISSSLKLMIQLNNNTVKVDQDILKYWLKNNTQIMFHATHCPTCGSKLVVINNLFLLLLWLLFPLSIYF